MKAQLDAGEESPLTAAVHLIFISLGIDRLRPPYSYNEIIRATIFKVLNESPCVTDLELRDELLRLTGNEFAYTGAGMGCARAGVAFWTLYGEIKKELNLRGLNL